jgi:hypothetical protein
MKTMALVCNEKEWTTYVGVVMKSEIRGIELVATRVCDESSQSPMLPTLVEEQVVECAVVLT